MRGLICFSLLLLSTASVCSADESASHLSNFSIGLGRHHDDAYNNAYAENDSIFRLACLTGSLQNEVVTSESDTDRGQYGYEVRLSMQADCVTKGDN